MKHLGPGSECLRMVTLLRSSFRKYLEAIELGDVRIGGIERGVGERVREADSRTEGLEEEVLLLLVNRLSPMHSLLITVSVVLHSTKNNT